MVEKIVRKALKLGEQLRQRRVHQANCLKLFDTNTTLRDRSENMSHKSVDGCFDLDGC